MSGLETSGDMESGTTTEVLLVEDERGHAELMRRAFRIATYAHHLRIAGSLREARAALAEKRPDILITDLRLPDGRGTELLPDGGKATGFPLVVLTSFGNEQVAVDAMKAGALDYVVKSDAILADMPRIAERALREWRLILERRRVEEERRRLESRLQQSQKLESLGLLAGGIAHDFNNLLMGVMGHANLALLQLPEGSPARGSIEDIETATERAAELCKQLLAYSGRGRFVVEAIDLTSLVDEMVHLLETAVSKSARLDLNMAGGLPPIEAAAGQVRQIVMNLIINASDALGSEPGVIALSTGTLLADAAYLEAVRGSGELEPGRYVYVEVTDTGCGMDASTRERLFGPFFTTESSGRGLGMAAVMGILRSHRGALLVDSEPGRGTTFRVLFPASEKAASAAAQQPHRGPQLGGAATVLVVDDDETIRTVTALALEGMGFLVLTAADGPAGIETYSRHRDEIQLILLDVSMPHLSGDDVLRRLQEMGLAAPVILSSGYEEEEVTARIPENGIAGFIQKPYRADALIAKIREVLPG